MKGWKKVRLNEFVWFQRGFDLPKSKFKNGNIPVYGSTSILGYHNSSKVKAPGIITGRSGTLGVMQYAERDFWPHNTSLWVKEFYGNDEKFAYYLLSCLDFTLFNSGGAVPTLNRNTLNSFIVDLPPLPTQRKIASILSAYDDLIENNLKRIKLLEEQAQLTYEEWFRVKGIPEGWKDYRLGELIEKHIGGGWGKDLAEIAFDDPAFVIRGTDMDNLQIGSIQKIPYRWHKKSNLKSRKLSHGDIIFEVSGGSSNEGVAKTVLITKDLLRQFDGYVMCASFCKLMRPNSQDFSYALILFLKHLRKTKGTEIFEKRSASNIVNYNWDAFLKYQRVKIPTAALLEDFNQIIEPLFTSIYNLGHQITKLKEARDILLPRLMTGMIDVENVKVS